MAKRGIFQTINYEKKYKQIRFILILFLFLFAGFIYMNFDYLAFKFFLSYNYIYTDTLDEIYVSTLSEENFKGYFKNFDDVAIAAFTEKIRETNNDRYTFLYTPEQYEIYKEYEKESVKESVVEEVAPGIVYMYIPNITKYTRKFVMDNKQKLAEYDNIIIDLQGNSGGMLNDMYKIADLFLENGQLIGSENTRFKLTSRKAEASGRKQLEYKNIVILQNSSTASACEGFTMALKENLDNVVIIGDVSFGKGIGQFTMPLKSGFAVKATVMRITTPSGDSIHEVGIEPDYTYAEDNIVEYAIKFIQDNR